MESAIITRHRSYALAKDMTLSMSGGFWSSGVQETGSVDVHLFVERPATSHVRQEVLGVVVDSAGLAEGGELAEGVAPCGGGAKCLLTYRARYAQSVTVLS